MVPSLATAGKSITCDQISVRFDGDREILRAATLQIPAGKIVALLGPSGCGKTTLLRCIAGLQRPTSGSVAFGEGGLRPGALSYVFQEPALLPWRTALQNTRLPLQLLREGSRKEQERRASESLDKMELRGSDQTKYAAALSGGMRMRVSLARALVTDPSILLLDEPFAALDDMLRSRLCNLVLQLHAQRARTIVFVTHNIGEAVFMSDSIVIMSQGKLGGEIEINFDETRSDALRATTAFMEYYKEVSDRLREATR